MIQIVAKHSSGIADAHDPLVANSIVNSAITRRAKESSAPGAPPRGR